jgi:flagellar protein FliO/FliZ
MELIDPHQIMRLMAALALVLGLMGALSLAVKKFNKNNPLVPGGKRRLGIVEILHVDARRKLVLLRRDGNEHLVVLGPAGETVIETGIESPQDVLTGHKDKTE